MHKIFIEPIPTLEQLLATSAEEDIEFVSRFKSDHRRSESLAWRGIVRRELGKACRIGYDEWGAPIVDREGTHIAVSHCDKFVAVVISASACGVDIEHTGRNFAGIASHYMSDKEMALSSDSKWRAKVWCAKEAIYKLCRGEQLNLKSDISIIECNSDAQLLVAQVGSGHRIEVSTEEYGEYIVALTQ